jgi:hypothetical protein
LPQFVDIGADLLCCTTAQTVTADLLLCLVRDFDANALIGVPTHVRTRIGKLPVPRHGRPTSSRAAAPAVAVGGDLEGQGETVYVAALEEGHVLTKHAGAARLAHRRPVTLGIPTARPQPE